MDFIHLHLLAIIKLLKIWTKHTALERINSFLQKQPSRSVLRKRCSENIQQIYKRAPMPKCDFDKVGLQLYWNHTSAWVFSAVNLLHIFKIPFSRNTSGWLLLFLYSFLFQRFACFLPFISNHYQSVKISNRRYIKGILVYKS